VRPNRERGSVFAPNLFSRQEIKTGKAQMRKSKKPPRGVRVPQEQQGRRGLRYGRLGRAEYVKCCIRLSELDIARWHGHSRSVSIACCRENRQKVFALGLGSRGVSKVIWDFSRSWGSRLRVHEPGPHDSMIGPLSQSKHSREKWCGPL
jgi:hypothetical protein